MFNSFADTTCNKNSILFNLDIFYLYSGEQKKQTKRDFSLCFTQVLETPTSETVSPCNMEDNGILLKNKFSFALFNLTVESFQWNWSSVH